MSSLALLEPLGVFVSIECYIWVLRPTHKLLWVPILACIVLSHLLHHERAAALGFQTGNLLKCLHRFGPFLLFLALAGLACGYVLHTTRTIGFRQGVFSFAAYLPWGLFQQYLLNGYFLRRFDAAVPRRAASMLSAALFSAAHAPNLFLITVALLGGYAATQLYRRCHNLYFLGLAHALLGFLLFLVVPDSISHHLNVGPGH